MEITIKTGMLNPAQSDVIFAVLRDMLNGDNTPDENEEILENIILVCTGKLSNNGDNCRAPEWYKRTV